MLKRLRLWMPVGLALVLLLPGQVAADPYLFGHYELHNHPYGAAAAPYYGLRLDGLVTGNASDIFTFDFDAPGASMWMDYSIGQIHIHGTAYGGKDVGTEYDSDAKLWDINFLYDTGLTAVKRDRHHGYQDLWTKTALPSLGNVGTISSTDGTFNLSDYSGGKGFTFRLGDTNNGATGRRGYQGISGWGWLNHCNEDVGTSCETHLSASDWLFTAQRVPEPGTLALFGIGATLMLIRRRRKS